MRSKRRWTWHPHRSRVQFQFYAKFLQFHLPSLVAFGMEVDTHSSNNWQGGFHIDNDILQLSFLLFWENWLQISVIKYLSEMESVFKCSTLLPLCVRNSDQKKQRKKFFNLSIVGGTIPMYMCRWLDLCALNKWRTFRLNSFDFDVNEIITVAEIKSMAFPSSHFDFKIHFV